MPAFQSFQPFIALQEAYRRIERSIGVADTHIVRFVI